MRKKVYAALLLTGALVISPIGGSMMDVVSASGNNTVSTGTDTPTFESVTEERIQSAPAGGTVKIERSDHINALSNSIMQELLRRGDVELIMECTYEGVDYTFRIPAGAAVDSDIPWYGPLWLNAHYGNGASVPVNNGSTYTVQSNDTLSKIADRIGMTLAELTAKNPQIEDVNKIRVGQQINLK